MTQHCIPFPRTLKVEFWSPQHFYVKVLPLSLCTICLGFLWLWSVRNSLHTWGTFQAIWSINGSVACCEVFNLNHFRFSCAFGLHGQYLTQLLCSKCTCSSFVLQEIDDRCIITNIGFLPYWYNHCSRLLFLTSTSSVNPKIITGY
jgi:hypothetical protein